MWGKDSTMRVRIDNRHLYFDGYADNNSFFNALFSQREWYSLCSALDVIIENINVKFSEGDAPDDTLFSDIRYALSDDRWGASFREAFKTFRDNLHKAISEAEGRTYSIYPHLDSDDDDALHLDFSSSEEFYEFSTNLSASDYGKSVCMSDYDDRTDFFEELLKRFNKHYGIVELIIFSYGHRDGNLSKATELMNTIDELLK